MRYFVRTDNDFSDTYNTLPEAEKCFERWKDDYMSEGVSMEESFVELREHEESAEDRLEESIVVKRVVAVIDEQQYEELGDPAENGMEFTYWAKWKEEVPADCSKPGSELVGDGKMYITHKQLDMRICDVEGGDNKETYRDFIRSSENQFGMDPLDIDNMPFKELNEHLSFLDYMWEK